MKELSKKTAPTAKKPKKKAPESHRTTTKPSGPPSVLYPTNIITDNDIFLFNEGSFFRMYEKMGAHPMEFNGQKGTHFAVWAPNATEVCVIGNFNYWQKNKHYLGPQKSSGIWTGFIPNIDQGEVYKYSIHTKQGHRMEKSDPFAFHAEFPPKSASTVWKLDYEWGDQEWMQNRKKHNSLESPISIYELHPGSWKRGPDNRWLNYRELAQELVPYLKDLGFTHVELMPVMEHPFYGSWGYQVSGYFSPTCRYGTPQDFMFFMDHLHQNGIGVYLDWVPSHFPCDGHALGLFDGTHLYEHSDPRKGFHPDWGSAIFNYGRYEVRSFLISNALFWLDKYHLDGLRVDAVASLLYLDYSRKAGEWIPNEHGGNENREAVYFIKRMNEVVYQNYPDVQTIAEESTAWAMVSRPTSVGGLGFGMKWDMGWMHDTLKYMSKEPVHRKYHHNEITFRMIYAFNENFVLSLSHDEVTHGKQSLLEKMPGDDWQKFANLRLLYGYMFGQPGKKLLFMGSEFAQRWEWYHESALNWGELHNESHRGIQKLLKDLNHLYRTENSLFENDFDNKGFEWINADDWEQSILLFLRKGKTEKDAMLIGCNFTPVPRPAYRTGVPWKAKWKEILNTDDKSYWGSGVLNPNIIQSEKKSHWARPCSLELTLPPLGAVFLKCLG